MVDDVAFRDASVSSAPSWVDVLGHREPDQVPDIARRLTSAGIAPEVAARVLADSGDALAADMESGRPGWEHDYGGMLGVALLAGEVSAQTAFRVSQASKVRGAAVAALLEDFNAVFVASQLGVSRQKVYGLGRAATRSRRGKK